MDLVEIDVVHLKAAEGIVAGFDDVLAAEAALVGARAHHAMHFGRDHDVIAHGHLFQMGSGDLLAEADGVHVRGVEEIDAEVNGLVKCCERLFFRYVAPVCAKRP